MVIVQRTICLNYELEISICCKNDSNCKLMLWEGKIYRKQQHRWRSKFWVVGASFEGLPISSPDSHLCTSVCKIYFSSNYIIAMKKLCMCHFWVFHLVETFLVPWHIFRGVYPTAFLKRTENFFHSQPHSCCGGKNLGLATWPQRLCPPPQKKKLAPMYRSNYVMKLFESLINDLFWKWFECGWDLIICKEDKVLFAIQSISTSD